MGKITFSKVFYEHSLLGRSQGLHHFLWCYFGDISSNIFDTSPVVLLHERTLEIRVEKYKQNSELEECFKKEKMALEF